MSRRALVALAVALAVAAAAAVLLIGSSPSDRRPPDSGPGLVVAQDGGRPAVTPSTPERTEQGARAAAITYATASQDWLYLSDDQIDRSVRAISTQDAGPALSRETVAELRAARDALARSSGRVWWFVRPLALRVERFDPSRARVVVWTVTVLSAADVALPQAEWLRVAVDLTWVDGAWRLESDAATKEDKGRRVDARHRRATQSLLDREQELVAGFAEMGYAALVSVCAASEEELEEHAEIVEQLAREAGMELRCLDARQDLAWASVLPLGLAPKSLLG